MTDIYLAIAQALLTLVGISFGYRYGYKRGMSHAMDWCEAVHPR